MSEELVPAGARLEHPGAGWGAPFPPPGLTLEPWEEQPDLLSLGPRPAKDTSRLNPAESLVGRWRSQGHRRPVGRSPGGWKTLRTGQLAGRACRLPRPDRRPERGKSPRGGVSTPPGSAMWPARGPGRPGPRGALLALRGAPKWGVSVQRRESPLAGLGGDWHRQADIPNVLASGGHPGTAGTTDPCISPFFPTSPPFPLYRRQWSQDPAAAPNARGRGDSCPPKN